MSREEAERWCSSNGYNATYMECSARTGHNVDAVFERLLDITFEPGMTIRVICFLHIGNVSGEPSPEVVRLCGRIDITEITGVANRRGKNTKAALHTGRPHT